MAAHSPEALTLAWQVSWLASPPPSGLSSLGLWGWRSGNSSVWLCSRKGRVCVDGRGPEQRLRGAALAEAPEPACSAETFWAELPKRKEVQAGGLSLVFVPPGGGDDRAVRRLSRCVQDSAPPARPASRW